MVIVGDSGSFHIALRTGQSHRVMMNVLLNSTLEYRDWFHLPVMLRVALVFPSTTPSKTSSSVLNCSI